MALSGGEAAGRPSGTASSRGRAQVVPTWASPHPWPAIFIFVDRSFKRAQAASRARQDHATANKFTRRIAASVGANIVGALHVAPRHNIQTGGEAQKPEDRGINRGQAGTSAPTLRRTTAHRAIAPRPPHAPARQTEPKVGVARCAGASGTERRRCGLARSRTARLPC